MFSRAVLISILVALSEARFGQEQIPIQAIQDVTSGGNPGEAATLAGASISFLLGAADPCGKLSQADLIVKTLGTGADSIAAAKGLVAAEQNFNPLPGAIPNICNDASLPATEALRGILPLIDPAVDGAATANAASAASLNSPVAANGKSIADLLVAAGFTNFKTPDGAAPAAGNGGNANTGTGATETTVAAPAVTTAPATGNDNSQCAAPVTVTVTAGADAAATAAPATGNNGAATGNEDVATGGNTGSTAGADFGSCVPTIKREGGLGGRPATEFTFIPVDPVVAQGQQEALNPNIITNRICDQLTNVCNANAAAKALCQTAKAQILASGARDDSVVTAWNSALGF